MSEERKAVLQEMVLEIERKLERIYELWYSKQLDEKETRYQLAVQREKLQAIDDELHY